MKIHSTFGMFYFIVIVIVIVIVTNTYTQSDEVMERQQQQQQETTKTVNIIDKMKYLCIEMDVKGEINQIKDKEQQSQYKKFLDKVNIYEMRELIDKFQEWRISN
jgi:hypothetical protein